MSLGEQGDLDPWPVYRRGVFSLLLHPHPSPGSCTCLLLGGCAGLHMLQQRCYRCTDSWIFVNIKAR